MAWHASQILSGRSSIPSSSSASVRKGAARQEGTVSESREKAERVVRPAQQTRKEEQKRVEFYGGQGKPMCRW